MMYDAYQGMADVGDRVRLLAQNANAILSAWATQPTASPWATLAESAAKLVAQRHRLQAAITALAT